MARLARVLCASSHAFVIESRSGLRVLEQSGTPDPLAVRVALELAEEVPAATSLVAERDGVSFAAVPSGALIVCAVDLASRAFAAEQLEALRDLAELAGSRARVESEQRHTGPLRELLDDLDAFVWEASLPDRRLVFVSRGAGALLGVGPRSLLGTDRLALVHPDDRAAVASRLATALERGDERIDLAHRAAGLGEVWIDDAVRVVRDQTGRAVALRGLASDVSRRLELDAAAREASERLQAILTGAPLGIVTFDLDRNVDTWSRGAEAIFGWTAAEVLGRPNPLVPAGALEEHERRFDRLREGELIPEHEEVRLRKDGSTIHVRVSAAPQRDDSGAVVGVLAMYVDASERRSAEQRRREVEERYKTLVEQLPLATYVRPLDWDAPLAYISPQVERITGYTAEEWRREPALLLRLLHPDDHELVRRERERGLEAGSFRAEYRIRAKDGRTVWVENHASIVTGPDGERHAQGYLLDTSDRRSLENQLLQAQKMEAVGRLAGGVAHDFNNLLTVIAGYTEFLLAGLPADDPLHADAREIAGAAERAAALTGQLLAFSRRQVLRPSVVTLEDVVRGVESLLRRLIGEDVALELELASEPSRVQADPAQLEQVLMNLVVNARDAMPRGGTLTISTRRTPVGGSRALELDVQPGTYSSVSVADTGVGIDLETRSQLFEPFFTTKEPGKGTGLGLATAYGIVRQSGGAIAVDSRVGVGSTFIVHLPEVAEQPAEAHLPAEAADANGSETILLVEDAEPVRALAEDALTRHGYTVLSAADGDEALRVLGSADGVDLVVADVVMPGMDGYELAERLRERAPGVRVLYMSGYALEPAGREAGADGDPVVAKPFRPEQLARRVREVLDA